MQNISEYKWETMIYLDNAVTSWYKPEGIYQGTDEPEKKKRQAYSNRDEMGVVKRSEKGGNQKCQR